MIEWNSLYSKGHDTLLPSYKCKRIVTSSKQNIIFTREFLLRFDSNYFLRLIILLIHNFFAPPKKLFEIHGCKLYANSHWVGKWLFLYKLLKKKIWIKRDKTGQDQFRSCCVFWLGFSYCSPQTLVEISIFRVFLHVFAIFWSKKDEKWGKKSIVWAYFQMPVDTKMLIYHPRKLKIQKAKIRKNWKIK